MHRLVKTGIAPKGAVFIYEGFIAGFSGESLISNPPSDNWTKLENFSQPIYWANRGFEVYAMDLRTHFIPANLNLSQASFIANWGFDQMMSDMKEGVNKAKELTGFPKIFMLGFGNGAWGAVNYAALYGKEDLRGLILLDADLPGPKGPVLAKRGNETNTYNLTQTLNSMIATGNWATTISATLRARYQYALDHPDAPAEYPPGTPLSPTIDPATNQTWANITEYIKYSLFNIGLYGPGGLGNTYGGYGNITLMIQYQSKTDRLYPSRYNLESNAWIDWVNCPYLKYDFDDHYSEINVPVLAISSQLLSNRTGTFRFVNGMATTDFTGKVLPNYGLFDLVIGIYSARDVSQPVLDWMINHLPQPLITSVTKSGASVTAGNIVSFYASVSGGVAPYTYQWYQGTNPVGTSPQLSFYPNAAGTFTYTCKITDTEGKIITSDSATLVVNSPSTPSPRSTAPSPTAIATPQPSVSPIPTATASPSAIPGGTQLALPAEAAYAIVAVVIVVVTTAIALALKRRPK